METALSCMRRTSEAVHERISLVCGAMFFLYMLNVVGDIVGRYFFLQPILGTVEIGENVLAVATFMTLGAVEAKRENIRVTLLEEHVGPSGKGWLDILARVCGLLFAGLLTWRGLLFALRSYGINEVAISLPIPIYIGKFAFFVGSALLLIQFALDLALQMYDASTKGIPTGKEGRK